MKTSARKTIREYVDRLIKEGEPLAPNSGGLPDRVRFTPEFAKWLAGCRNLIQMLGKHGEAWKTEFDIKGNRENGKLMLGTLRAIHEAIDLNLLVTVEDMVFAEAFADLLEQADHLFSGGYALPAAVLGRAVLEEHLRKWCDRTGCTPTKAKPTISDFKGELYKAKHIDKVAQAHVDAMAATGNLAAHNLPGLKEDDVERLLRDVREFLVKNPLS